MTTESRSTAKTTKKVRLFDNVSRSLESQLAKQYSTSLFSPSLADHRPHRGKPCLPSAITSMHDSGVDCPGSSDETLVGSISSHRPSKSSNRSGSSVAPELEPHEVVETLAARYGKVSNMVILDRSYRTFINKTRTAALSYKVLNQVAVISGDPICHPDLYAEVLDEFKAYRRKRHWGVAFVGVSETLATYARQQHWKTVHFGLERALNPMTNDVLMEQCGKRMLVQNKHLLDPAKCGITLGVYIPSYQEDSTLQRELMAIYDAWCGQRNQRASPQAFITVYNPFDFPGLMTYIYTRAADGSTNGFAALRWMGAVQGYHIDPCIAALNSPKGITDLLVFAAMTLVNSAGLSHLSLGCESLEQLGEITGMSPRLERSMRSISNNTLRRLPIRGKKMYHDKFRPDPALESKLYLVFPSRGLGFLRQLVAVSHVANVSFRSVIRAKASPRSTKRTGHL